MFKKGIIVAIPSSFIILANIFGFSNNTVSPTFAKEQEQVLSKESHSDDYVVLDYDDILAVEPEPIVVEPVKEKLVLPTREGHVKLSYSNATTLDLTSKSKITSDEINRVLENSHLAGTGEYYIEAEEVYGVNAIYLVSHAILESGWGKSRLSKERNNIYGFMAYDSNVNKAMSFNSKRECILHVAEYLSINYLSNNGKHYNGKDLKSVNKNYASDDSWHKKVASIMTKF